MDRMNDALLSELEVNLAVMRDANNEMCSALRSQQERFYEAVRKFNHAHAQARALIVVELVNTGKKI